MKQFFLFWFFCIAALAFPVVAAAQSLGWTYTWGNPDDSEEGEDIVIDGQGRILVAGTTNYDPGEGSSSRGFVLRLTSTGQIDPTFNGDGNNDGVIYIDFPNSSDEVHAIALNSDGDILLAGKTNVIEGCIFKVKGTDGSLVTTFGTGGRVVLPEAAELNDLIVQPDQKIVSVGWGIVVSAQDADYIVARFTINGQKDPAFSNDGWTNIEFEDDDLGQSIERQSDGKLVVSGYNWTCGTSSCDDFSVARLLSNGQLDPDFGGSGGTLLFKSSPQTGSASCRNMALHNVNNEQRILLSGEHTSNDDSFLFRLRDVGNTDASFGSVGFKEYTQIGLWQPVAIQGDNKILVAGSGYGFEVLRTTINGTVDAAFGSSGVFKATLSNFTIAEKIISMGNMIYVVGYTSSGSAYDVAVTKINNTNVVSTASPDAAAIGMSIYPNPSAGDINIRFTANEGGPAQLRIFNLTGQLAYEMPVELLPGQEQIISLPLASQLNAGNYLVQLQTQHLLASKKLVIEQ